MQSVILIEVADTLKQPPSESKSMRKANSFAISTAAFFYISIGCIGYAAFGDSVPGNLLVGFGFFNPYWLVTLANIFVWAHVLGSYQVLMQPLMQAFESTIIGFFPKVKILQLKWVANLPVVGRTEFMPLKMVTRTLLVCTTTVLAALLPFFNSLVGIIGALVFHPLTVYFPTQIYLKHRQIQRYSSRWLAVQALSAFTLCISLAAAIGSIASLIINVKGFSPFESVSNSIATP